MPPIFTVNGGNLQVGDAADPTAKLTGTVNVTGATLSGHGTVVGNVTIGNGGTLAPGGSVGTLSIQGNLVMTTAMSYLIDLSSTGASSTAVTGTAALGGTVQVFSSNNSYRLNSPYTILTSAGLGGTQFTGVVPMTGITEALSYTANSVQLTLTSALGQLTGLNANQRAVATTLDAAFNSGGSTGPLGAIFNGNIPFNLTQASGELATGSQQTTFDAMNLFMGVLTDPFIAGRGDGITAAAGTPSFAEENGSATAYAANGKARSQSERDAYGMMTKAPPMADSFTQRWSVWAAGFGGAQTTDGNAARGIEHRNQPDRRHRGGRRLSLLAVHDRRLRARRRRHQFLARQRPGDRSFRSVPGRRLCAARGWPGLYLGGAGLRLAGCHHGPHAHHRRCRPAACGIQRQCILRPRRIRLPLCDAMDGR